MLWMNGVITVAKKMWFISRDLPSSLIMYVWFIPQSYKNKNTTLSEQVKKIKIKQKNRKKRQISLGHVHQCTRLKMSAVTLLPVFPPNWKVGVGNSSTNRNPVKKHREKEQVKKYASFFIFSGWLWPQGGLEKHCQPNKLSMALSVMFPGPSKDREPFSK